MPVWEKLYRSEPNMELAKEVGYFGKPIPETRQRVDELVKRYGKEAMEKASRDIVRIDTTTEPPTARLTDEIRKVAAQLLGPAPENWETFYRYASGQPTPEYEAKMAILQGDKKEEPVKKKRTRKKATIPASGVEKKQSHDSHKVENAGATPAPAPIIQQWKEAKERHPGMILLFRVNDCYVAYEDDAWTVARALNLGLQARDNLMTTDFLQKDLELHLKKLIQAGHRVALLDPVEPKDVDREYELRKVLDRDKTPKERKEADRLTKKIRGEVTHVVFQAGTEEETADAIEEIAGQLE